MDTRRLFLAFPIHPIPSLVCTLTQSFTLLPQHTASFIVSFVIPPIGTTSDCLLVQQHILEFACSKGGLILYKLDPAQATEDQEAAKASLAKALEITKANVLISQQAGDDVNYARLCEQVIPEIQIFNVEDGELFISPRFPHLRFPIHTGFGYGEMAGMIPYKDMLTSNGQLPHYLERFELTPQTPLMGELIMGPDGLPSLGKILSNEEVQSSGVWPTYSAILNKEYQEIEGVGVVF